MTATSPPYALHAAGIPSVDLQDFLTGTPEQRAAFVRELGQAYEEVGFVAVRNHGLSEAQTDALYRSVQAFLDRILPPKAPTKSPGPLAKEAILGLDRNMPKAASKGTSKNFFRWARKSPRNTR